jgi:ABC-type multidrug transport system ATPase subunit
MVNFCLDRWEDDISVGKKNDTVHVNMPCTFDNVQGQDSIFYSLMYNITHIETSFLGGFKKPLPHYRGLYALKTFIDNAILALKHEEKGWEGESAKLTVNFQDFPYNPDRIVRKADPIQAFGSFYLVMIPLTIFIVMYDEMVREKVIGLRMGLQVIGCSKQAFWTAWMITGLVFNVFMVVSMIVVGRLFNFSVFVRAPVSVLFPLFFLSGLNNLAVAFLMTTLMKTQVQAYTTSFSVLLAQVIVTMVLHDATIIYKVFFNVDMPAWVDLPRGLFYFMPTFHFVKIYGDVSRTVCTHFRLDQPTWVDGEEWQDSDFYLEKKGLFATKDRYHVSSIFRSFQLQAYFTLFYFFLAWYFDNVLDSNTGHGESWFFFLRPSYWIPRMEQKKARRKASAFIERPSQTDFSIDTAREEERLVKMLEHQKEENIGLRIVGISKTYEGSYFGRSTSDVDALKKLYIEVSEGELLGIMGHNGAGKSTLINVIAGLTVPNRGTARLYEHSITEDMDEIRGKLGVVFQYDVLWDELTGFEHLKLFSEIKRIEPTNFQEMAEKRLKDVGLLKAGTLSVGQYSGGMRRRMSVALSTIGDPRIILMDEPTTGMDPVSKKAVWRLIQSCKQGRVIILTTHEMGEAELLSDKLCVIEAGELKCIGAPL